MKVCLCSRTLAVESVANGKIRTWAAIRFRPVSLSGAEQSMHELTLTHRITLYQPADLPFANRMHCLVAFDGAPRPFRRPESEAGDDSFLDESVSCSMMLLRYDDVRQRQRRPSSPDSFSSRMARAYAGCPFRWRRGRVPVWRSRWSQVWGYAVASGGRRNRKEAVSSLRPDCPRFSPAGYGMSCL